MHQSGTRADIPDASTFGARLALIRQLRGWSNVAQAARECGVPVDSWRNWEVDGRMPQRLTTIAMQIASAARVDYLWLVHGPGRGEPTDGYPRVDPLGPRVLAREVRSEDVGPRLLPARAVGSTRPLRRSDPKRALAGASV